MELKGKVAVVTGSSRGVGRANALALGRGGCSVVVNYVSSETEANEVVNAIKADGGQAVAVQGNVADDAVCRKLMDTAMESVNDVMEGAVAEFRQRANDAGLRLIPDFAPLTIPRRP